jgi:hypothetical protein
MEGCDNGLVSVAGEVQGARTVGVRLEGLHAVVDYGVGLEMLDIVS